MRFLFIYISVFFFLVTSCKKTLDKKPNQKLVVPTSLRDFRFLLDRPEITETSVPGVLVIGTDEYYMDYSTFQSQAIQVKNCYTWSKDIWNGVSSIDWNLPYATIYYCNVVLEGLTNFPVNSPGDQNEWNNIFGHALFVRATTHFFLEETFGQPYKPSTSDTALGIPIKISDNLSDVATRSSVMSVYNQIIQDLLNASDLLPPNVTGPRNRPTKATAFAMLARVYLQMQDYQKAKEFADRSLVINSVIQDYNGSGFGSAAASSLTPFPIAPNDFVEVLYPAFQLSYGMPIGANNAIIDSTLYKSFDTNDWRRTIFFANNPSNQKYFKGNYSGNLYMGFSGPATDELYLIKAECLARLGNKDSSLFMLNELLKKRWKTGTFTDIVTVDAESALTKVLIERKKELVFRGLRWLDLRRLNQDTRFATTLTRKLNNEIYTLPPNDIRYTYPIPENEIQLNGIQQNPR